MPGIDVLIVGGGVIGWACAQCLATRGAHVLVVEPGPQPGAATPASAGMLAAQAEAGHQERDAVLALSVLARDKALATARELADTTRIHLGLLETGILYIALDEGEMDDLRAGVARQRQLGLRADWLDATEVREEWPGTAPAMGAAFAPEDAALDPGALVKALRADGERAGARHAPERVVTLDVQRGRALGVLTEHGRHEADAVVVAAGAWSTELGLLPRRLPVKPVRGQMIALPWPDGIAPAIVYGSGGYLLARGAEALVGSTMESVGFDASTTPEAETHLAGVAGRLVPALADGSVSRHWAGLRPLTPDGLPIIGRDPAVEGLWYATGHGRNGILFAALTGEIIGDLVLTGRSPVDTELVGPSRFFRPRA